MQELVRMENICGSNILSHARLSVMRGEIAGLLGMNNAGKTELLNILAGRQRPETGKIYFEDRPVSLTSPMRANECGIYYLHEEEQILKDITVAENILVMRKNPGRDLFSRKRIVERCSQLLGILFTEETGIGLDAEDYLRELNDLQLLAVQIVKAISADAKLIIIDHYLDGFAQPWVESLQKWLELLSKKLYLSFIVTDHRAHNLVRLCDRIFVLRRGMNAGAFGRENCDEKILTSVMTGSLMENGAVPGRPVQEGEAILSFRGVRVPGERARLEAELLPGEMTGICCMSHRFMQSFCDMFTGEQPVREGEIVLDGNVLRISSPDDATDYGIGLVLGKSGLFPNMSFTENVSITALRKFSAKTGVINNGATSLAMSEALSIWKLPYLMPENADKVDRYTEKKMLISRAMAILPRVMIYQNLDKGLDDIAYDRLIKQILEMPIKPKASLFVSQNIQNLIKMCTKIYFVYEGGVVNTVYPSKTNRETLLSYYRSFCAL